MSRWFRATAAVVLKSVQVLMAEVLVEERRFKRRVRLPNQPLSGERIQPTAQAVGDPEVQTGHIVDTTDRGHG